MRAWQAKVASIRCRECATLRCFLLGPPPCASETGLAAASSVRARRRPRAAAAAAAARRAGRARARGQRPCPGVWTEGRGGDRQACWCRRRQRDQRLPHHKALSAARCALAALDECTSASTNTAPDGPQGFVLAARSKGSDYATCLPARAAATTATLARLGQAAVGKGILLPSWLGLAGLHSTDRLLSCLVYSEGASLLALSMSLGGPKLLAHAPC